MKAPRLSRKRSLAVALVLVLAPCIASAETVNSVESWMEAGFGYELPLDFSVTLSTQLKLDEDMSRVKSLLPQAELGFRANEWLKFSGGYRLIYERDKYNEFEFGHRLFIDGQASVGEAKLRFKYRLRFQDKWEWNRDGELRNRPTLRNMVGARYKVNKWFRPTVSAEHFLALNALDSAPTRKWRVTVGPQIELWKTDLDLFYRLEVASDNATANLTHIIGLGMFATPWSD